MNILVIGSGGREHALCWALRRSAKVKKLYCAPGNGGVARMAECVALAGFEEIAAFCADKDIGLVVIGPEQPLADGLADRLRGVGVRTFGPSREAARLEGSKGYAKDFCARHAIPTGAYGRFGNAEAAKAYIAHQSMPIVIKADGLAGGKGVVIAHRRREAERVVDDMFGDAGGAIVVEEFLEGEEISFFALCDGETAVELGAAQDHKRAFDGDTGPNTGGMGAYAPPPVATEALRRRIMQEIVLPTVRGMKEEGTPFHGVLFVGLMITTRGPMVIEYNVRFGDPETQVLMPLLNEDLAEVLASAADGKLPARPIKIKNAAALCVVMAAKGYPGPYEKGSVIGNLDAAEAMEDVTVFHAGTALADGKALASGGRVLGVTALGKDVAEAAAKAYAAVDAIAWPEGFCRRDIGWRAIGK